MSSLKYKGVDISALNLHKPQYKKSKTSSSRESVVIDITDDTDEDVIDITDDDTVKAREETRKRENARRVLELASRITYENEIEDDAINSILAILVPEFKKQGIYLKTSVVPSDQSPSDKRKNWPVGKKVIMVHLWKMDGTADTRHYSVSTNMFSDNYDTPTVDIYDSFTRDINEAEMKQMKLNYPDEYTFHKHQPQKQTGLDCGIYAVSFVRDLLDENLRKYYEQYSSMNNERVVWKYVRNRKGEKYLRDQFVKALTGQVLFPLFDKQRSLD